MCGSLEPCRTSYMHAIVPGTRNTNTLKKIDTILEVPVTWKNRKNIKLK